jgi:methionine-rich copper-binding protein CopC
MRPLLLAAALAALVSSGAASAQAMSMVESSPVASAVIGTRSAEFFVRFDGPVDHRRSRLLVTQNGKVVETLHPRLDARPSVLFARGPGLPPGDYMLHWDVISLQGAQQATGDIPFSVRPE